MRSIVERLAGPGVPLLLVAALALGPAATARATLVAEDFLYAANSELRTQNGGTNWGGAWSTDTSRAYALDGSLSYAGGGYAVVFCNPRGSSGYSEE